MMEGLLIKNVLSNKERKKLIKDCQPLLEDFGERFPGKQTRPYIHKDPRFFEPMVTMMKRIHQETGKNFIIKKSWINYTNGSKKDKDWHDHLDVVDRGAGYIMVYYIKIPLPFFSNGTLFREEGFIKAPQNSILIFPPHLKHATPTSPFRLDRYTMSMDLLNDSRI